MTEQQIDRLVARILQRLQPPVLVVVTPAEGYRHAIRQRLAGCGERLHLALDEGINDSEQWAAIGETLPVAQPSAPYKALLLPFLDYSLAADLVNGALQHPAARRAHDALLAGIPVLALRYHCDPYSELNQLCGAAQRDYATHMSGMLARLATCGVVLCTMNELLERLATGASVQAPPGGRGRYLTVTDIVHNPSLADLPDAVLTDAAVDFLKAQKK